jgi:hypothetical protein
MRNGLTPLLLLLACLTLCAPRPAHAQTRSSEPAPASSSPVAVVRGFYAWYLGRLNKDDWSPLRRRREALRYLTAEFHRKAPAITRRWDADIFICAQDWMKEWEQEFKVAPASLRGAKAATVVTLPVRGGEDIRIKVMLRRVGSAWKIEATDCLLSSEGSR